MEAYLSGIVEGAEAEQSDGINLMIPMEDIQQAPVDPSYNIPTNPTTADTHPVKERLLLEISADKKRVTTVVEISEPSQGKQFLLTREDIEYTATELKFSQHVLEEDITDCMQDMDDHSNAFLSISPNGDRIAISFFKFDSEGNFTSVQPTCSIFGVDESGIRLVKKIKCQGKAVFTSDDHLAIVSLDTLDLYSTTKEGYKLARCLNIGHLLSSNLPYFYKSWYYPLDSMGSSYTGWLETEGMKEIVVKILLLTRFVHNNVLVLCSNSISLYYTEHYSCIWSLPDGVRSLPYSMLDGEDIHAISSDKTLVAIFGAKSTCINVHQINTGLLVSKLELDKSTLQARRSSPLLFRKLSQYCVSFSKDNEYVFLISILNTRSEDKALLVVEAWSRNTEKSIFQHQEKINFSWRLGGNIMPYIFEIDDSPSTFTAVFPLTSRNGALTLGFLKLGLFDNVTIENWKIEESSSIYSLCWMSLQSYVNDVRYQLRFDLRSIQLWRLCKFGLQEVEELVYIHGFQSPRYHQGQAFNDNWRLEYEDYKQLPFNSSVRFIKGYRIAVKIKYGGMLCQEERSPLNNDPVQQDEIYLPLRKIWLAEQQESFEFVDADFHHIGSACCALKTYSGYKYDYHYAEVFRQTKLLVERSIEKMKQEKSRYFTTISGSNTLALLASFQEGRDIIFQILKTDELPINLFTYVRVGAQTDKRKSWKTLERKENALTVLLEYFDYELFGLLLNRALLHAPKLGVGAFGSIGDAMIFLQERSETAILRESCKKLKFLSVEPIRADLRDLDMDLNLFHNSMNAQLSEFSSYAPLEQLPRYNNAFRNIRAFDKLRQCSINTRKALNKILGIRWYLFYYFRLFYPKRMANTDLLSVCVVPFVHSSSYTISWEDPEFAWYSNNRSDNTVRAQLNELFRNLLHLPNTKTRTVYKAKSDLLRLASKQHENDLFHQKGSVIEVLLYYKWKTFIRRRFYLVCLIHLVYYLSFSFGVLYARECFAYTPGTSLSASTGHVALIALMFAMHLILSIQELFQFLNIGPGRYFTSIYNVVDLAALVMPPICFRLMIAGNSNLDEVSAITIVILWVHGILRLRPFAFIGVTLETMIQLMKSVYKTLFIMLLVIFAFTHAFITLLLHKDDSYFQEQYSGSMNISGSEQTVNYSDTSASNSFTNVFKAFSTLWLFIYGVWDPITDGDAGDDFMIIVFAMLFSFVTVLLFFNLVIALMSSKAEEVKALGKSIWLSHFAEVIAEIEQFWCTRSERVNRNNSPSVVYYVAKNTDIRQQAEILEQECDELIKELQVKLEKRQRAGRSTQ